MRIELTVDRLMVIYQAGLERGATPHREPDFTEIIKAAKLGKDTPLRGNKVFIEENNTGYDGVLERWIFTAEANDTKSSPLTFMVDILPDIVVVN